MKFDRIPKALERVLVSLGLGTRFEFKGRARENDATTRHDRAPCERLSALA